LLLKQPQSIGGKRTLYQRSCKVGGCGLYILFTSWGTKELRLLLFPRIPPKPKWFTRVRGNSTIASSARLNHVTVLMFQMQTIQASVASHHASPVAYSSTVDHRQVAVCKTATAKHTTKMISVVLEGFCTRSCRRNLTADLKPIDKWLPLTQTSRIEWAVVRDLVLKVFLYEGGVDLVGIGIEQPASRLLDIWHVNNPFDLPRCLSKNS
jgi:hypothetical protein